MYGVKKKTKVVTLYGRYYGNTVHAIKVDGVLYRPKNAHNVPLTRGKLRKNLAKLLNRGLRGTGMVKVKDTFHYVYIDQRMVFKPNSSNRYEA